MERLLFAATDLHTVEAELLCDIVRTVADQQLITELPQTSSSVYFGNTKRDNVRKYRTEQ